MTNFAIIPLNPAQKEAMEAVLLQALTNASSTKAAIWLKQVRYGDQIIVTDAHETESLLKYIKDCTWVNDQSVEYRRQAYQAMVSLASLVSRELHGKSVAIAAVAA